MRNYKAEIQKKFQEIRGQKFQCPHDAALVYIPVRIKYNHFFGLGSVYHTVVFKTIFQGKKDSFPVGSEIVQTIDQIENLRIL